MPAGLTLQYGLKYRLHMDKESIAITIRLDKEVHRKIKILAAQRGQTIKDMFLECMERLFVEEESKKGK